MNTVNTKKITINQVAEYCGVSKSTISHFLNGKFENMSDETRNRISAAIKTLNYRPDRSAQRLKASQTKLIGCVVGNVSSPFTALLLKGATSVCEAAGYQVLLANSQENLKRERRNIQGFLDNRVDGLIVNTCGGNDDYLISLQESGIPLVLADRTLATSGQIDTVCIANKSVAENCTRYLLAQGYTSVAYFTEAMVNIAPRLQRCDGYRNALGSRKPEIYELTQSDEDNTAESLMSFIARHPGERIAILTSNGTTAQRILVALNTMKIQTGYQLGLCTFDDWDWLKIANPSVTAVSLRTAEIGIRAAELLLGRIRGERRNAEPCELIIPSELIVRESTPSSIN